jgi:hypothetical protein
VVPPLRGCSAEQAYEVCDSWRVMARPMCSFSWLLSAICSIPSDGIEEGSCLARVRWGVHVRREDVASSYVGTKVVATKGCTSHVSIPIAHNPAGARTAGRELSESSVVS